MLIKCPECTQTISSQSVCCVHCGLPLQSTTQKKKPKKRLRLPNGFGQITELKNQTLRNRFRVSVTVGKNSNGQCVKRLLKPNAYFHTYNEAYNALVEYHKNPYDLDNAITVKELYEKWIVEYSATLKSESSFRTIKSAWSYCSSVYDMRVMDLRARHIKGCMDEGEANINGRTTKASSGTKARIKSMFNLMLDYALEYEIVDRNYARTFSISDRVLKNIEESKRGHMIFKDSEMKCLWDHVDRIQYVDVILIQCYTGFRPQELGLIQIKNVDLEKGILVGGMKTEAGTNRSVPIPDIIRPLIEKRYQEAINLQSEYLINCTDTKTHRSSLLFTYDKYQKRFKKIVNELGLDPNHRAHDGRMHYITMAKKCGMDEYAIKRIVGHQILDITEKTYTDRSVDWLIEETKKLKQNVEVM